MKNVFLTASWNHLIMANYAVDPQVLQAYVPAHTELDLYEGKCYVSLVGFLFDHVKIRGWSIPFHTRFPEVNLRFYVRYKEQGQWKRGVVFISEIVPKPAISWVANVLYKEHYSTMPVRQLFQKETGQLTVGYTWIYKGKDNKLQVTAGPEPVPLPANSFEEFITEHFWGYSAGPGGKTVEYQVAHPRWNIFPVRQYELTCDFGRLYGDKFAFLNQAQPVSVFLAEGSPVKIFTKRVL
jgi:uncharacterized protein